MDESHQQTLVRVFDFSMSASFAFLILKVSAMEVRTMLRGPRRSERLTVGGGLSLLSHGYCNLHGHLCALARLGWCEVLFHGTRLRGVSFCHGLQEEGIVSKEPGGRGV